MEKPTTQIPFPQLLEQFLWDPNTLRWQVPGIWLINKPPGPSSNAVVVRARKRLQVKRIGHAGTLDPMAQGLLILLAGNASRLFDHFQAFTKSYTAGFALGRRTDSQDATGTDLAGWTPSRQGPIDRTEMETVLATFTGEILQIPPMHSALKKDGVPLYKLARKGIEIERQARPVSVHSLRLDHFDGSDGQLAMTVSKGFYVRTLIDDIGEALGTGAVMTSLVRTAIGPFTLTDAVEVDSLEPVV